MSGTDKQVIQMPEDWDDHKGWNDYYKMHCPEKGKPFVGFNDLFAFFAVNEFIHELQRQGVRKLWFPGCGYSVMPSVYAAFGFRVWASDVSEAVIEYQRSLPPFSEFVPELLSQCVEIDLPDDEARQNGELHFRVHDFRFPLDEAGFDCILNDNAFQALPLRSKKSAAAVHEQALKLGGHAYFSTMNVQGGLRNTIEECLIAAGFHIPNRETDRWYRKMLDDTGLDYSLVLGRPRACWHTRGIYSAFGGILGRWRNKHDQARLNRFQAEYDTRSQQERTQLAHLLTDGRTKVARVAYNTG